MQGISSRAARRLPTRPLPGTGRPQYSPRGLGPGLLPAAARHPVQPARAVRSRCRLGLGAVAREVVQGDHVQRRVRAEHSLETFLLCYFISLVLFFTPFLLPSFSSFLSFGFIIYLLILFHFFLLVIRFFRFTPFFAVAKDLGLSFNSPKLYIPPYRLLLLLLILPSGGACSDEPGIGGFY